MKPLSAVGLKNLKDSLFERLYRTARQHTDAHRTYDMLCRQGRICTPKWLCSPIKLSMKVGCCLSDCRINWKIPGNINRLSFYPSRPEPMGSSAKNKPFGSKDCCPSGRNCL